MMHAISAIWWDPELDICRGSFDPILMSFRSQN